MARRSLPGPAARPRVVVAPTAFKGTLGAVEAARAMAAGLVRGWPEAVPDLAPMADGGDGTVAALLYGRGGRLVEASVTGPLGEPVTAAFGLLDAGRAAVIEMAAASGLALVPPERRDPAVTTTAGTGELIRAALDRGVETIWLGAGGSATVDAGAGALAALGCRLLDGAGRPIPPGAAGLRRLARIDPQGLDPRLRRVRLVVLADVDNPLLGPEGAAAVFGPQKGAAPEAVPGLEAALERFAATVRRDVGVEVAQVPRGGAAGGLAAGLAAVCGAELAAGGEAVADAVGLDGRLGGAALAVTGEGRLDGQTARGKAPWVVLRRAAAVGVPVVALAGAVGPGVEGLRGAGLVAAWPVVPGPVSEAEAARHAAAWCEAAAERLGATWRAAWAAGRGGVPGFDGEPGSPGSLPEREG